MTIEALLQERAEAVKLQRELYMNATGGETPQEEAAMRAKAEATSGTDLVGMAFDTVNAAVGMGYKMAQVGIEKDPNFKIEDHWDSLVSGVPTSYVGEFLSAESLTEAIYIKERINKELESKAILEAAGYRGFGAQMLASLVDVDAALMLASGGTLLAPKVGMGLSKLGVSTSSKLYGMATMATAGAEAAALTETVNVMARPTSDATDVMAATLGGMAFGGVLGIAAKSSAIQNLATNEKGMVDIPFGGRGNPEDDVNKAIAGMQDEITARKAAGEQPSLYDDDFKAYAHARDFDLTLAGIDATQAAPHLAQAADRWLPTDNAPTPNANTKMSTGAALFGTGTALFGAVLQKTPVAGDYYAFANSKSKVAKFLGAISLEASQGHGRINRSASNLSEQYQNMIGAPFMRTLPTAQSLWAKENNMSALDMLRPSAQLRFGREFRLHQNAVYLREHGTAVPYTARGESLKALGEASDLTTAKGTELSKGRAGENGVRGWEEVTPAAGWLPQIWVPAAVQRAIKELNRVHGEGKGKQVLVDTLSDQYQRLHGWEKKDADTWANAVVRRAIAGNRGADTNVYAMLRQDGVQYAVDFLTQSGVSRVDAEKMVDSLMKRSAGAKDVSYTQKRGDIDVSTPLAGTSLQLVDLLDNDIGRVMNQYSRRTAGHAALARHGIQMQDRNLWIDAIDKELEAIGEPPMNRNQLNALFDMFDGGAIGDGVNPWLRRANQITYLGLLNGQWFTQSLEFSAAMAGVGVKNFVKDFFPTVMDVIKGRTGSLEEFSDLLPQVYGEHLLHRPHDMLEEYRMSTEYFEDVGKFLDRGLGTAQNIQGYTSGLYKLKEIQQRMVIKAYLRKLHAHFTGKELISEARLYDMGLGDVGLQKRLSKYFTGDNPVVKDTPDGVNYNSQDWDWRDREDLGLILNRQTNLVIQKAMKGEESYLYSTTGGAALTALKRWTLTALNKQAVRSGRIGDMQSAALLSYSTAAGGIVYAAREAAAGREENITWGKMGAAAIGYGSITGPIAMGFDPLMVMIGQDDWTVSQYDRKGVFGMPVQLETLNRTMGIPASTIKAVTGNATAKDIYNIQAAPLIGNMPMFTYLWQDMKEDIRAKRKEEQKAVRAEKAAAKKVEKQQTMQASTPESGQVINKLTKDTTAE